MRSTKMTPILLLLLLNLAIAWPLSAQEETSLQVRSAAFLPSSPLFRKIYADAVVSYGVEASIPLLYRLHGWSNFDWLSKEGRSDGFNEPTDVTIANISFGIKMPYQLCSQLRPYLGIGPTFSKIWLKNQACCCGKHDAKWVFGGVLKAGIYCPLTDCLFIDLFADYYYQPVHFEEKVDIGGGKLGAGIGVAF